MREDIKFLLISICFFIFGFSLIIPLISRQEPVDAASLTFGYTSTTSTSQADLGQYGAYCTRFTCPYNGTVQSITAYIITYTVPIFTVQTALYKSSDNSWIATTETKTTTPVMSNWITFNFSDPKPKVSANTQYLLAADSSAANVKVYFSYLTDADFYGARDTVANSIVFANPWSSDGTYTRKFLIYATYLNTGPTFSNPSPSNGSTGQSLTPQCAITIGDVDVDKMTLTWQENSTGSWVTRQVNNSCVNGTYRFTYSQATTNNHKYYWRVYANDGAGNNMSAWYCFTTVASTSRAWKSLFSGYEKGGNNTVPWRSLFSGYLKGGNATVPWRSLFSGYLKGGNATIPWRSLFSGYLKGGNSTILWRSLFSGWFTGGNVSARNWLSLLNGYFTGGNITNFRSLFSGYFKGGNITNYRSLFSGYETGGNATVSYHSLFSGWFSGGNVSLDKLYITDVYPANGSTAAIKTSITATIEQIDGLAFNISWFGSDDNGSSWFTLGSTISVNNGTWGVGFWNASILNKTYYWRIEVVDTDLNYANATYLFTTAAMGTTANQIQLLGQGNTPLAIMGGVLFVLPIGMLFMIMGKRKKQKEGNKKDDRTDDVFNP